MHARGPHFRVVFRHDCCVMTWRPWRSHVSCTCNCKTSHVLSRLCFQLVQGRYGHPLWLGTRCWVVTWKYWVRISAWLDVYHRGSVVVLIQCFKMFKRLDSALLSMVGLLRTINNPWAWKHFRKYQGIDLISSLIMSLHCHHMHSTT